MSIILTESEKATISNKIEEICQYYKKGSLLKVKKNIQFYEYESMFNFLNSFKTDPNTTTLPALRTLEADPGQFILLIRISIIDESFFAHGDNGLLVDIEKNMKNGYIRLYFEFLVENKKAIKVIRVYPDPSKAFFAIRERLSFNNDIQNQLFCGLDGEVLSNLIEKVSEEIETGGGSHEY